MIPFVDLKAQYHSIKSEIDAAITRIIENTSFIGGKEVDLFEKEFASYLSIDHCISCGNGTDALEIMLKAFGVGPGDEVIVPAISWISTSEAVGNVGAVPVFVDIDEEYYTIDAKKIKGAITDKTKAIIPVHLYGQMCDMDTVMQIAKTHGLKVLEDCAQAHGAKQNGQMAGTIGQGAAFSFFPGKNLGAYGDAGAMVCNDKDLADHCRMLARHGQLYQKHVHYIEGRNSRLDTLQAAILRAKLPYLNQWTKARKQVAHWYNQYLDHQKVLLPKIRTEDGYVFHLYVIQVNNRPEVEKALDEAEISHAVHYPTPLPFLQCYQQRKFKKEDFPVSARLQDKILSLPIYPEMTEEMVKEVCNVVNKTAE